MAFQNSLDFLLFAIGYAKVLKLIENIDLMPNWVDQCVIFYDESNPWKVTLFEKIINCIALTFSEQQIETLSPNPATLNAGKTLSAKSKWLLVAGEHDIAFKGKS